MKFSYLWTLIATLSAVFASPPGVFDPVNGTYDEQTSMEFDRTLYYKMLNRTFIGPLSRAGMKVKGMNAFEAGTIEGTACIWKKMINEGDMVRYSLVEAVDGLGSYGDLDPSRGNHLGYGNMEVRVNEVDSPAIPVPGRNSQRRVKRSLGDLKPQVRGRVRDWGAQELEIQALTALIGGADAGTLKSTSDGGLADTLGIRSSGTASQALMPRHFYTPQGGYLDYSSTQATWNTTVDTAIGAITEAAGGYVTLAHVDIMRDQMDSLGIQAPTMNGKQYKAIFLCDPRIVWRLNHLLATYYQSSRERSKSNPIFGVDHQVEFDGCLYLSIRALEGMRVDQGSGANANCPDWGTGNLTNVLNTDHRTISNTNDYCWMIGLGAGGLLHGYDDALWITDAEAEHGKGIEYVAHQDMGFKRGDWFPQDGRTAVASCISYGCFASVFYDDGVGQGW